MSSLDVAKAAGVSEAAVVRFAQALSFSGFPELRAHLQQQTLARLVPAEAGRTNWPVRLDPEVPDRILELDHAILNATHAANPWERFVPVIELLATAKHVAVVGHGTSYGAAHQLAVGLTQLLGTASYVSSGSGDMFDRLATLTPEDVLVGVGLAPYIRHTIQAMDLARARRSVTIAITDSSASPLVPLADHVFITPIDALQYTWSPVGVTWISNVLLAGVIGHDYERTIEHRTARDDLMRRYDAVHDHRARQVPTVAGRKPGRERVP